jgi:hypothetical protein
VTKSTSPPTPAAAAAAVTSALPAQLAELLTSLGVDPVSAGLSRRPHTKAGDFLVLPSPARPQLLVPCIPAAGVMIKERRARGVRATLTKSAVAAGLSSGLTGRLPLLRLNLGESGFNDLLGWITEDAAAHEAPFSAGILVGPPRANRKPVLRIFTATGRTWGYAKVGINDLTNALIRRETDALAEVGEWPLLTLRAPRILKAGEFGGNAVLATSPLATAGANRQPTSLPVEPTRELFRLHTQSDVRLRAAPAMKAPSPVDTPEATRIEALADRLLAVIGDELIPLGASHGDWTPWNMAWTGSGASAVLEAWDWERATIGVPQGHDVVHFEASKVRVDDPGNAETELLAHLPARLAACGIDAGLSSRLLTTYLVTIGRRYAADLALEHVAPLARRLDWVSDLLDREVTRLELHATPDLGASR